MLQTVTSKTDRSSPRGAAWTVWAGLACLAVAGIAYLINSVIADVLPSDQKIGADVVAVVLTTIFALGPLAFGVPTLAGHVWPRWVVLGYALFAVALVVTAFSLTGHTVPLIDIYAAGLIAAFVLMCIRPRRTRLSPS
jgi:hypothetical protein